MKEYELSNDFAPFSGLGLGGGAFLHWLYLRALLLVLEQRLTPLAHLLLSARGVIAASAAVPVKPRGINVTSRRRLTALTKSGRRVRRLRCAAHAPPVDAAEHEHGTHGADGKRSCVANPHTQQGPPTWPSAVYAEVVGEGKAHKVSERRR